jgi:hypothetical protein
MIQKRFDFFIFDALKQQAEAMKQQGMELGARRNAATIAAGQAAFLQALLSSTCGYCSIDDATADLAEPFRDGGKWRGTVVRELAVAGIIEPIGTTVSLRPSRHKGLLHCWRVKDRDKAKRRLARLLEQSNCATKNPQTAATAAGAEVEITQTEQLRNSSNATFW